MIFRNLTSQAWVDHIAGQIDDARTYSDPEHYGAKEELHEDHGTCQHSFLSPDGDAVSVTASINLIWGCNVPPAKNNFISPGKRPMSSMSTTVVVDEEERVVAVAGASGGTKIITAVAQVK